ncbi:RNA-binding protein EWS isoform X2 [Abrus precatorius]|uniref:RNA-binding protein EWS isoform X2 n=1 Tax=Abrus precatorius TaxID=3816 RepID=A0A8B8LPW9_ABRPR|nr:RNA-binding protein EWS isoform X2 [Abrus precatorius]
MGSSREKEQAPPHHHQPLLSSLVVRPSHSEAAAAAGGRSSDYEPGELHRDLPPPYSRSDRYPDEPGSSSPVHRRDADHRFGSDYNHLSRSRGYGGGRDPGRYRELSPPYGRGRVGGRPIGRTFDGPGFAPGLARGEGNNRNNPNVRPREGDWICPDPLCGNLNFARRDYCNSCNRSRHAPARSPRRAYPAPPPLHAPPRRFPGPPIDRSPERALNGYRSPPRGLARDGPREYGSTAVPPLRHEGRFLDPHVRRERVDYIEDAYRGRSKFDRPPPLDWDNRDRGRDGFNDERKGFERRPLSPPAPLLPSLPHHRGGRWARDARERSRSPVRGGPPPKDYRRAMLMNRARDDRRGLGRDRIGGMY